MTLLFNILFPISFSVRLFVVIMLPRYSSSSVVLMISFPIFISFMGLVLMILHFFPPNTHSAVAQNRIQAAQAVQPAHIDPKKRFAQLRLRKLYPPSSNIVKYSFSLQPIMNNPFYLAANHF